jgi:trans-aconitate methyltransferase
MSFDVAAATYDRFMGRFSEPLGAALLDRVDVSPGQRAVDVGCGPGALTTLLVGCLGADQVAAIDPSEPFVEAVRSRLPGVDVRRGAAESLPWEGGSFDLATANLVVHFMKDPVTGLREMARVTRSGGTVAVTVWDLAEDVGPVGVFHAATHDLDPDAPHEQGLPGARPGHLAELVREAGMEVLDDRPLEIAVRFASLDDWWEPFTFGVGPSGGYVASLEEPQRAAVRRRCAERIGVTDEDAPFDLPARAWSVVARPRSAGTAQRL